MSDHILIVEDEDKLASLMSEYLEQSYFTSNIISDGALVVNWVKENPTSLILLDLMLPNKDGMQICKEIREFSNVPIIMVTARVEEIDRLLGLELGADDYVCKPYSPREVVARVKAVLKRTGSGFQKNRNEQLDIDEPSMKAMLLNEDLDLTAVEFQLLSVMVEHPGQIFSRDQLMSKVYADHRIVSDRTIDSHVKKLRKKITNVSSAHELIHSIYGVGYKYEWITAEIE